MSPDWYTVLLKASQTEQLSQEELACAHQTMSAEQYAAEFECDPYAAIVGAFYGQDIAACEAEGRITTLPLEPGVPVHTAWDLGHRHSTAIIDFYENHGQYADHYCGVVSARGKTKQEKTAAKGARQAPRVTRQPRSRARWRAGG